MDPLTAQDIMESTSTSSSSAPISNPISSARIKDDPLPTSSRPVGIDFGTTYSCVGIYNEKLNCVEIVEDNMGEKMIRSFVGYYDEPVNRVVSIEAEMQAAFAPRNVIYAIKRILGRAWTDAEVQSYRKISPVEIVQGDRSRPLFKLTWKGKETLITPEEVCSAILSQLKMMADDHLNDKATKAVVACPASFDSNQRQALKDSCVLAGFSEIKLVSEPICAVIACEHNSGLLKKSTGEHNILVYDMGSGKTEATVLTILRGKSTADVTIEVKGTVRKEMDRAVSGFNFDQRLVEYCIEQFKKKHKKDPSSDAKSIRRLFRAAERAKVHLSRRFEAHIEIDAFFEGIDFSLTVTRARFEYLCQDLFQMCMEPIANVLDQTKLQKNAIDDIILVGGSTRMPQLQQLISAFFNGKTPNTSVDPEQAVCVGASLYAAILAGTYGKGVLVADVTPLSLGIEIQDGLFSILIPKGTPLPCEVKKTFTTSIDNVQTIRIVVYEGECALARDNKMMSSFDINDIPRALKGTPQINVVFRVEENGALKVFAADESSGASKNVTFLSGGRILLEKTEIQKLLDHANQHRVNDAKVKEAFAAKAALEGRCLSYSKLARDALSHPNKSIQSLASELEKECSNVFAWLDEVSRKSEVASSNQYRAKSAHDYNAILERLETRGKEICEKMKNISDESTREKQTKETTMVA